MIGRAGRGVALLDPGDDRLLRLQHLEDESVFPLVVPGTMTADGRLHTPAADGRGWFGQTPRQLAALLPGKGVVWIASVGVPDPRLTEFVRTLQGIRGIENPVLYTPTQITVTEGGLPRQHDGDLPMFEQAPAPTRTGSRLWLIAYDITPDDALRDGFGINTPALLWTPEAAEADLSTRLSSMPGHQLYVVVADNNTHPDHTLLPEHIDGNRILGHRLHGAGLNRHTFISLPTAAAAMRGALPDLPDRLLGQLLLHTHQVTPGTFTLLSPARIGPPADTPPPTDPGADPPVRYVTHLAADPTLAAQVELTNGKLHTITLADLAAELAPPPGGAVELLLLPNPGTPTGHAAAAWQLAQWHAQRRSTPQVKITTLDAAQWRVRSFEYLLGQPTMDLDSDETLPYPASGVLYVRGRFMPLPDPAGPRPDTTRVRYHPEHDLVTSIGSDQNITALGYWPDASTRATRLTITDPGHYEVTVDSVTYTRPLPPGWDHLAEVDLISIGGRGEYVARDPATGVLLDAWHLPDLAPASVAEAGLPVGLEHSTSTRTLTVEADGKLTVDDIRLDNPGAGAGEQVRAGHADGLLYVFARHTRHVLAVAAQTAPLDLDADEARRILAHARNTIGRRVPEQPGHGETDQPATVTAEGTLQTRGLTFHDLPHTDQDSITIRYHQHTRLVTVYTTGTRTVLAVDIAYDGGLAAALATIGQPIDPTHPTTTDHDQTEHTLTRSPFYHRGAWINLPAQLIGTNILARYHKQTHLVTITTPDGTVAGAGRWPGRKHPYRHILNGKKADITFLGTSMRLEVVRTPGLAEVDVLVGDDGAHRSVDPDSGEVLRTWRFPQRLFAEKEKLDAGTLTLPTRLRNAPSNPYPVVDRKGVYLPAETGRRSGLYLGVPRAEVGDTVEVIEDGDFFYALKQGTVVGVAALPTFDDEAEDPPDGGLSAALAKIGEPIEPTWPLTRHEQTEHTVTRSPFYHRGAWIDLPPELIRSKVLTRYDTRTHLVTITTLDRIVRGAGRWPGKEHPGRYLLDGTKATITNLGSAIVLQVVLTSGLAEVDVLVGDDGKHQSVDPGTGEVLRTWRYPQRLLTEKAQLDAGTLSLPARLRDAVPVSHPVMKKRRVRLPAEAGRHGGLYLGTPRAELGDTVDVIEDGDFFYALEPGTDHVVGVAALPEFIDAAEDPPDGGLSAALAKIGEPIEPAEPLARHAQTEHTVTRSRFYHRGAWIDLPPELIGSKVLARYDKQTHLVTITTLDTIVRGAGRWPGKEHPRQYTVQMDTIAACTFLGSSIRLDVLRAPGPAKVDVLFGDDGEHRSVDPDTGEVHRTWRFPLRLLTEKAQLDAGTLTLRAELRDAPSNPYPVGTNRRVYLPAETGRHGGLSLGVPLAKSDTVDVIEDGDFIYGLEGDRVVGVAALPVFDDAAEESPDGGLLAARARMGQPIEPFEPTANHMQTERTVTRATFYHRGAWINLAPELVGSKVLARYDTRTHLVTVTTLDRIVRGAGIWPGKEPPRQYPIQGKTATITFLDTMIAFDILRTPGLAKVDVLVGDDGEQTSVDPDTGKRERIWRFPPRLLAEKAQLDAGTLTLPAELHGAPRTQYPVRDRRGVYLPAKPGHHRGLILGVPLAEGDTVDVIEDGDFFYALKQETVVGVAALPVFVDEVEDPPDGGLSEALERIGQPIEPFEPTGRHVQTEHVTGARFYHRGAWIDLPPELVGSEVLARYHKHTHLVMVTTRAGIVVGAGIWPGKEHPNPVKVNGKRVAFDFLGTRFVLAVLHTPGLRRVDVLVKDDGEHWAVDPDTGKTQRIWRFPQRLLTEKAQLDAGTLTLPTRLRNAPSTQHRVKGPQVHLTAEAGRHGGVYLGVPGAEVGDTVKVIEDGDFFYAVKLGTDDVVGVAALPEFVDEAQDLDGAGVAGSSAGVSSSAADVSGTAPVPVRGVARGRVAMARGRVARARKAAGERAGVGEAESAGGRRGGRGRGVGRRVTRVTRQRGSSGSGDVAASVPGLVAELVGLGWSVVGGVWGEGVLGEVFPWLGLVNPWRGVGGDFVTNCVVAAIGLDLALRDVAEGVPLDRVGYQVPPEGPSLVGWLANYAGRGLVEVAGWGSVAEFMGVAPVGSRGFVVFEDGVGGRQHVVNVVRDGRLGVVFLDGQHGRQAWTPPVVGRMRFVATTAGVTPVTVAPPVVVVAGGEDVAGMATPAPAATDTTTEPLGESDVPARLTPAASAGAGVLRMLDPSVEARYRTEAARSRGKLADPEQRTEALQELDRLLSEWIGVPAAAAVLFVSDGPGGFDPLIWSVSLAVGEMDPDQLASNLLQGIRQKNEFFLISRWMVPHVSGPQELAERVGTINLDVARLAWARAGLPAGSPEFEAAAQWWAENGFDAIGPPHVDGAHEEDAEGLLRASRSVPWLPTGASEASRRVVANSQLASIPAGATIYWPADARRVRDVIVGGGGLPSYGLPTGKLGPGYYTLGAAEAGQQYATDENIDPPALVELRLRRAAVGLRVGDTAMTEETSGELLAAVLDHYDFLADPDGELVKFHPRFLDFVEVRLVSLGTDNRWLRPWEFVAALPQWMADRLTTDHPELIREPRTHDATSRMLRGLGYAAPFEVVELLRLRSYDEAGLAAPALSRERLVAFLEKVWPLRRDILARRVRIYDLHNRKDVARPLTMTRAVYLQKIRAIADKRPAGSFVAVQFRGTFIDRVRGDAGSAGGCRLLPFLPPRRDGRAPSGSGVHRFLAGRDGRLNARPRPGGGGQLRRVSGCVVGEGGRPPPTRGVGRPAPARPGMGRPDHRLRRKPSGRVPGRPVAPPIRSEECSSGHVRRCHPRRDTACDGGRRRGRGAVDRPKRQLGQAHVAHDRGGAAARNGLGRVSGPASSVTCVETASTWTRRTITSPPNTSRTGSGNTRSTRLPNSRRAYPRRCRSTLPRSTEGWAGCPTSRTPMCGWTTLPISSPPPGCAPPCGRSPGPCRTWTRSWPTQCPASSPTCCWPARPGSNASRCCRERCSCACSRSSPATRPPRCSAWAIATPPVRRTSPSLSGWPGSACCTCRRTWSARRWPARCSGPGWTVPTWV